MLLIGQIKWGLGTDCCTEVEVTGDFETASVNRVRQGKAWLVALRHNKKRRIEDKYRSF